MITHLGILRVKWEARADERVSYVRLEALRAVRQYFNTDAVAKGGSDYEDRVTRVRRGDSVELLDHRCGVGGGGEGGEEEEEEAECQRWSGGACERAVHME